MKKLILIIIQITAFAILIPIFGQDRVIFENGNIYTVYNNPTSPTKFVLTQPFVITSIVTYHWNNARGSKPGTIGLRDSKGNVYGAWSTTGSPGQGGVPNAYWKATPNVKIPAGEFTVIDSEPTTWAQNSGSKNSGFTIVRGYLWKPTGQRQLVAIVENQSKVNVLIWQDPYEPKGPQDVLNYHLEPGWKTGLKVIITANGVIKFVAGSGGSTSTGQYNKVLGSCTWNDDPSNTSRVPHVIFTANQQIVCRDGKR
ncbi:MAG: hypothetical protein AAB336_04865 [Acidobacteriota bacterium]